MTSLVPLTVQDALAVAQQLASSGMVPKDYVGKPGAIYAAIDLGASVGLRPMQSVQGIANINGRPALWGDAASAVVMAHPSCESVDEDDAQKSQSQGFGRCRVVRKGSPPHEVRFTVDMAKTAGLWGKQGPWTQYPGRMLQMRARSWAFRDKFPDALKGIAIVEEVIDVPATVTVVEDMMPRATAAVVDAAPDPTHEPTHHPTTVALNPGENVVRVLGVEVSTGTNAKTGKQWTRYGVSASLDGAEADVLSTFSDTLGGVAKTLVDKDAIVLVESRVVGDKTYLDLKSIRAA